MIEPKNLIGKYVVTIFQKRQKHVVDYVPLKLSENFSKTIFCFLKTDKESSCKVIIHGKTVNQKDELGMKVSSQLLFTGAEKNH